MIIYHGSQEIIEKPEFGKGRVNNDYGQGFYCTEYIDLAKEWACDGNNSGYANQYELDMTNLKVLDLNSSDFCVIHWISILLKNRTFTVDSDVQARAKEYILENFPVSTEGYDVIKGYRADDSYFTYAKDFLQNSISVRRLSQVLKLGNLGQQIVLISKEAFNNIKYIGYEEASFGIYYPLRKNRDELARIEYLSNKQGFDFRDDDLYIIDIIRNRIGKDDPRI